MAKADFYFTFHFWGDDEAIEEMNKRSDLQEMLDGMVDDLIGDCEEFSYVADLTNHLTGDTVKRESTKG